MLIVTGIGGFTPRHGFMGKTGWQSGCDRMHTAGGLFRPIPITPSTDAASAARVALGQDIALLGRDGGSVQTTMTITGSTRSAWRTSAGPCSVPPTSGAVRRGPIAHRGRDEGLGPGRRFRVGPGATGYLRSRA